MNEVHTNVRIKHSDLRDLQKIKQDSAFNSQEAIEHISSLYRSNFFAGAQLDNLIAVYKALPNISIAKLAKSGFIDIRVN